MYLCPNFLKTHNKMAKNRPTKREEEEIINIVDVKEQAQDFFEQHKKSISIALGALILLVGGYLAYTYLYMAPKEKAAAEAIFQAENQFARDSFALALENPGEGFEGFLDIIDNYSGTKTANLAKFYAGISYLHLGKYDDAIKHLESFSPKGKVSPALKFGSLGDAYAESGNMDKALSNYKKAADTKENEFITPYYLSKAAGLAFTLNKNDEALKLFQRISKEFPESAEAKEAEKFVARLEK